MLFLSLGTGKTGGYTYVYPFLCFAGDQHGVWLYNKAVLAGMGLFLWTTNWFVLRRKS